MSRAASSKRTPSCCLRAPRKRTFASPSVGSATRAPSSPRQVCRTTSAPSSADFQRTLSQRRPMAPMVSHPHTYTQKKGRTCPLCRRLAQTRPHTCTHLHEMSAIHRDMFPIRHDRRRVPWDFEQHEQHGVRSRCKQLKTKSTGRHVKKR